MSQSSQITDITQTQNRNSKSSTLSVSNPIKCLSTVQISQQKQQYIDEFAKQYNLNIPGDVNCIPADERSVYSFEVSSIHTDSGQETITIHKSLSDFSKLERNINKEIKKNKTWKLYQESLKKSPISLIRNIVKTEKGSTDDEHQIRESYLSSLEDYLNSIVQNEFIIKTDSVMEFFDVSELNCSNFQKVKQTFINKRTGGYFQNRSCTLGCSSRFFSQWKRRFLTITTEGIMYSIGNKGNLVNIREVLMFDHNFKMEYTMPNLNVRKKESLQIRFLTPQRQLVILADSLIHFIDIIGSVNHAISLSIYSHTHRFNSFAPIRSNTLSRWFTNGEDYYKEVYERILSAEVEIFITGWWLCPEVYLKRPVGETENQETRLDRVLKRVAERGVQVYIIVYREPKIALNLNSFFTKYTLENQQKSNIHILRHPNPFIPLLWSHHEKLVVIDSQIAFLGGLDICFGRWDTSSYELTDLASSSNSHMFPGIDYANQRIVNFSNVSNSQVTPLNRETQPRMPWHDISMMVFGESAYDLARHFIQYWNFAKVDLYSKGSQTKLGHLIPVKEKVKPQNDKQKPPNFFKRYLHTISEKPKQKETLLESEQVLEMREIDKQPLQYNPKPRTKQEVEKINNFQTKNDEENKLECHDDEIAGTENLKNIPQLRLPSLSQRKSHKQNGQNTDLKNNNTCESTIIEVSSKQEQKQNQIAQLPTVHGYKDQNIPQFEEFDASDAKNYFDIPDRKDQNSSPEKPIIRQITSMFKSIFHNSNNENNTDTDNRNQQIQRDNEIQLSPTFKKVSSQRKSIRQIFGFSGPKELRQNGSTELTHGEEQPGNKRLFPKRNSLLQKQQGEDDIVAIKAIQANLGNVSMNSCQSLRSSCSWSLGLNQSSHEMSIMNAYLNSIQNAKNFIYIENQYFISCTDSSRRGVVRNTIAETLIARIIKAAQLKENFKVMVVIPLLPGFPGEIDSASSGAMKIQLYWEHVTISRGETSMLQILKNHPDILDVNKYITFYGLRQHGVLNGTPVTEMLYVHSKLMIVDDSIAIIGSANINDRSMLGTKDSEIAMIVDNEEVITRRWCGVEKQSIGGAFSFSLRRSLYMQHFGLTKEEAEDPVCEKINDLIAQRAKTNTEVYREVFACYPDDNIETIDQIQAFKEKRDLNKYESLKGNIIGRVVEQPLNFLAKEDLSISFSTKEYFVPAESFV